MEHGESSYRRFLNGDDNGLAEIIRAYNDGLTLYLNSIVNNLSVADELSEEVFVKLGVRRPRFSGRSSFKTWLYAIGRNIAIDFLRKNAKTHRISLEDCVEPMSEETPESAYFREERKLQLHRAMKRLKTEYRQVLWLKYFEELHTKEIAKIMKKSVQNTEVLVHRARQALKSELEQEGFADENL